MDVRQCQGRVRVPATTVCLLDKKRVAGRYTDPVECPLILNRLHRRHLSRQVTGSLRWQRRVAAEIVGPAGLSRDAVHRRAKKIEFRAMDSRGKVFLDTASDFAARVLQHEIDHLNGVLLIDRLDFNQREILLGDYQRL